jgi:hypothetical protein
VAVGASVGGWVGRSVGIGEGVSEDIGNGVSDGSAVKDIGGKLVAVTTVGVNEGKGIWVCDALTVGVDAVVLIGNGVHVPVGKGEFVQVGTPVLVLVAVARTIGVTRFALAPAAITFFVVTCAAVTSCFICGTIAAISSSSVSTACAATVTSTLIAAGSSTVNTSTASICSRTTRTAAATSSDDCPGACASFAAACAISRWMMALAVLFGARITRAAFILFLISFCTGRARKLLHTEHINRAITAVRANTHLTRGLM